MKHLLAILALSMIFFYGCSSPTAVPKGKPFPTNQIPTKTKTPTPTPTLTPIILTGCVNTSSLRVRSAPGTESNIFERRLIAGECVSTIGRSVDGDWVYVLDGSFSGWVSKEYINIDGNIKQLSIVSGNGQSNSQSYNSLILQEREDALNDYLHFVVNDPIYDQNTRVLHKYIDAILIELNTDRLTYTFVGEIESEDEFKVLSYDLILLGAKASNPGKERDWNLQAIDVINPGALKSNVKYYVEGVDTILGIANQQISIYDVMENEVDYGVMQMPTETATSTISPRSPTPIVMKTETTTTTITPSPPTPIVKKTDTPHPDYTLCKDTRVNIGSFITCKIPKAYCLYQPGIDGKPTYCNDEKYPRHNFTLIIWGNDWSDLDGSCILISGRVSLYLSKPQIEANKRSQVTNCP